ncbi:hypothetical protein FJ981_04405 [Mesorhizobium sp. B1-1-4]|uniref:hypothetical protein n=1 Tax=unclassified Mesorhizobium TaxID=325217 RepID=UPI00112BA0C5|nr:MULTISPECIES: hypothetical protein [unclassified Mesorhizobium]MBZ9919726.1 hypothetical protein [Mesorhizobium sp. BR1-1-7]MBZ9954337.1 hypothetical protein [Mesorhizobium sp. BR1-1-15]MBZ9969503.1 hypothetical protein [Mesorhizobium sp. BR1-1-12]TPN59616.1 hypothetical protein FJ981_04405 [Mesorhizobium sp. B1-1-4]
MSRELTSGFALVAQVAEKEISSIFVKTFLGLMPKIQRSVEGVTVNIWFGNLSPSVRLIASNNPFENLVEISLPFIGRASDQFDECVGTLVVRPSLIQTEVQQNGQTLIAPMVDFRGLSVAAFEVSVNKDKFKAVMHQALFDSLKGQGTITAGPLFPTSGRPFFFKTFLSAPPRANILAVFIADVGNVPDLPDSANTLTNSIMVLVPVETINANIHDQLAAHGLGQLPAGLEGGTLTSLSIELKAGHVFVKGTMDADVGPFTSTVHFKAWLTLFVQGGNVQVSVARTQQDTDILGDLLDFFSAGAVTRALEEAIPAAVKSIGGGAFGTLGLFADEVPFEQSFAAAQASGSILIRPDGLGIPVALTNRVSPATEKPTYMRAHKLSREFHVPSGCQFGDLINATNIRRFVSWQEAVQVGYDGCKTCQPQFNITVFGQVVIHVSGPFQQSEGMPQVEAVLTDNVVRFDVQVSPLKETAGRAFAQTNNGTTDFRYFISPIVPGRWQLSIRWDDWAVISPVDVARRWIRHDGHWEGQSTVVRTKRGEDQVAVTYEA